MRSACAIGLSLVFLFAGDMARAQQTPSPAKLTPANPAVNKTTCERTVAKIGVASPTVTTANLFAAMDVNKDGKIDATEYKGPKKAFAWVDTDHDGYITRPEGMRAYLTIVGRMAIEQRKDAFKNMDENKDGKVSLAEYRGPTRAFARIDVNHDGVITPDESKHAFQASVDRFVIAMRFRALDTNHDGKLSAAEFKGPTSAFAKYSDKNGLISRAEFAKMISERAAARLVATAKPVPTPAKPVALVRKTDVVKQVKATATSAPKPVTHAAHAGGLNRILAMDTNKDGKVGMGEYFKAVEARFVFLDQDKDGYITASDVAKVAAIRNAKGTSAPVAASPAKTTVKPATLKPAKPADVKPAVKPGITVSKPLAAAIEVLPSKIDVSFDRIDVNHDGVLSRTEIKVYLAKQPHKATTTTVSHHKG